MLTEILLVSIIAGAISIDIRTIGGTMISRPLVISPLIGLLLGDLKTGFIIATLLELIWIGLPPIGAYLPIEALPIAVVATSFSIILKNNITNIPVLSIIVFSIVVAIPFGFIGRWMESHIRTFNSTLSSWAVSKAETGNLSSVAVLHYLNILISFLKGFVLCFVPVYFGYDLLLRIFQSLPNQIKEGMLFSAWIIPVLGFAVVMEIFISNKYLKYFLLSSVASLLLFYAIKLIQ